MSQMFCSQSDCQGVFRQNARLYRPQIQTRLLVGPVDDPLEREADAVAERVVRSDHITPSAVPVATTPPALLQRKCAECEEKNEDSPLVQRQAMEAEPDEEKPGLLQRATADSAAAAAPPELDARLSAARGSGQSLPGSTRAFMESRIGADFSDVRVHTDGQAATLNRDLRAHAFTHGSDIYFNTGKYAPETAEGQRLLAHELTHVVQQREAPESASVQRLSPGDTSMQVSGVLRDSARQENFVYFDRNESVIPAEQMEEIDAFISANTDAPEIHLYGYASEEGNDAGNTTLIADRLEAVRDRIQHPSGSLAGYTGLVTLHPRLSASHNQIDYRRFRAVEMSTGPSVVGASVENDSPRDCSIDEHAEVDAARDGTTPKIRSAIDQLVAYQGNRAANPAMQTMLDNNFHSHSRDTVEKLLDQLRAMVSDLEGMNGNRRRRCGGVNYGSCFGALAITHRLQMTFCPAFFHPDNSPEMRQEDIIHELGHYTRYEARDRSYRGERVLRYLTTRQALDNAESIAIFVIEANNPEHARVESTMTNPLPDTVTGCGSNQSTVEEALAWSQRWNTYARFGVAQTYSSGDNFAFMLPHISSWFGRVNRYSLAGIYDRYISLDRIFRQDFEFQCVDTSDPDCSPAHSIVYLPISQIFKVCPAYFNKTDRQQIIALYAELTKMVPEIRDDQREAYPQLARAYKLFFWEAW